MFDLVVPDYKSCDETDEMHMIELKNIDKIWLKSYVKIARNGNIYFKCSQIFIKFFSHSSPVLRQ